MPLSLSWVIKTDMGTLTGAEMNGSPMALVGDALMAGYYTNELLLNFLHKHDSQPDVFGLYAQTIRGMAGVQDIAPVLREFEMELLRLLGYALNLDHDSTSHGPLQSDLLYEYRVERGPVRVTERRSSMTFSGAQLVSIRQKQFQRDEVLRDASILLREIIAFHLGGKELKSRKVLVDLKRSR